MKQKSEQGKGTWLSLFLFVLIEVLGFSLVLPLLPYLVQEYGLSPTQAGWLQSSNAIAQLLAVPFIGSLSDQWGRKPMLVLCIFGTFVSFVMLAVAKSAFWVFFSRILDGIIGGNISLAHAYISDITEEKDRSQGLGLIGAAFGMGFVVGPALGGILVKRHPQAPSALAALLSFVNLIMVLLFLPESLPVENRLKSQKGTNVFSVLYEQLRDSLIDRKLRLMLLIRFLHMCVFTIFETTFGFFNKDIGNDPKVAGYLLCWFGLVYSFVQGGGIKAMKKKFNDDDMLVASQLILTIFYLLLSTHSTYAQEFWTLIPLGLASGLSHTLTTTKVSLAVWKTSLGGVFGVSAALASLSRIIAPVVTGYIIELYGSSSPFVLCAILSIMLALLVHHQLRKEP